MKNVDMPAMPILLEQKITMPDGSVLQVDPVESYNGLTKREQFCLKMGVPDTGDSVLDDIIRKGERKRIAAMAMQGLLSNSVMGDSALHYSAEDWVKEIIESSVEYADSILKELEKMSEFTKGPWISKEESGTFDIESDNLLIGVVLGFDPDHTGFNVCSECQANASLIAAAPDMYEVLQSIINTWDGPLYRHEMAPNIDKARKALAKAQGEL